MQINKTAYDYNKGVWHRDYNPFGKYQLHHICNRQSVGLCCLRLFSAGLPNHQLDTKFVGDLRKKYNGDYLKAQKNYDKVSGCREKIFVECDDCYFFSEDR